MFVVLRNGLAGLNGESSGCKIGVAVRKEGRSGEPNGEDGDSGRAGRANGDLRTELDALKGVEDVCIGISKVRGIWGRNDGAWIKMEVEMRTMLLANLNCGGRLDPGILRRGM